MTKGVVSGISHTLNNKSNLAFSYFVMLANFSTVSEELRSRKLLFCENTERFYSIH